MDAGWLQQGAAKAVGIALLWGNVLGWQLAAAMTVSLLLAGVAARLRYRRRLARHAEAVRLDAETRALKEALQARLEGPGEVVGGAIAPALGVSEAFERDIEAAAGTVLREAGGFRGKAKALLRARLEGEAAAGDKLNGSEAAYWRQLGALSMLDSTADAVRAYARAAELAPQDAQALMQAGVLNLRAGRLPAAEAMFRRHIALGEGAEHGAKLRYRGQIMLGDVELAREDRAAALAAYEAARADLVNLIAQDSADVVLQRDLSMTCDRIGDVRLAEGDREAALEHYRKSLDMAEALARSDPRNAVWQHDLSVSCDRVGAVLQEAGDLDGALDMFRKGLATAQRSAAERPANAQWRWDLSTSHDRLGDVLIEQGKLAEALESYREGLAIAEAIVAADPARVDRQRDLAVSLHRIGLLEAQRGNVAEAREFLERGRRIIARLERIASRQAQWRADLSRFDAALNTIGT